MANTEFVQNGNVTGDQLFQNLPGWLNEPLSSLISAIPVIISATIILIVGWIVGAFFGGIVKRLASKIGLDKKLRSTPIGNAFGDSRNPVAVFLGTLTKWFIFALALLAAADLLAIPLLSQWIANALSYIPVFIGGLLIILLGFILADFVGDAINRTKTATKYRYTSIFADAVRFFLYFAVIVMGLQTMGIDTQILYIFARALAWGLALGIGAAIALALGWGGKDYVKNNIDNWTSNAQDKMKE